MITCKPEGIFSWDFQLEGSSPEEVAAIEFQWLSEQGTITTSSARYEVAKLGIFSGEWELISNGNKVATAKKTSPFTRRFEINYDDHFAVLEKQSAFSRDMSLTTRDGGGYITRLHPFTRQSTIKIRGVPFHIQCFAFWLTVLIWRRDSRNS